MAQFLALIPMTAGNFDSESATDGHVLTADGSGGAAWEEGGGGGGASFAWDGVTFTPGEFVEDSGARGIEIEFTLGGNAITSGSIGFVGAATSSGGEIWGDSWDINGADYRFYLWDGIYSIIASLMCGVTASDGHAIATGEIYNTTVGVDVDVYIRVILPSGAVVVSDAISIPGVGE